MLKFIYIPKYYDKIILDVVNYLKSGDRNE